MLINLNGQTFKLSDLKFIGQVKVDSVFSSMGQYKLSINYEVMIDICGNAHKFNQGYEIRNLKESELEEATSKYKPLVETNRMELEKFWHTLVMGNQLSLIKEVTLPNPTENEIGESN